MALVLSTSLALTTGVASAHTNSSMRAAVKCQNLTCDGKNPIQMGCASDAQDEAYGVSGDLEGGHRVTVILRYSAACQAAWAFVTTDVWGDTNAIVTRNSDSRQYDCAHGGNDIVHGNLGETTCFSGMVGDAGSLRSWAAGMYRVNSNHPWQQVANTTPF